MSNHTPTKLRTVRNLETGEVTSQSSNKTKRLLALGCYEEVTMNRQPGGVTRVQAPPARRAWRRIGLTAAAITMAAIVLVWLRLVNFI